MNKHEIYARLCVSSVKRGMKYMTTGKLDPSKVADELNKIYQQTGGPVYVVPVDKPLPGIKVVRRLIKQTEWRTRNKWMDTDTDKWNVKDMVEYIYQQQNYEDDMGRTYHHTKEKLAAHAYLEGAQKDKFFCVYDEYYADWVKREV